MRHWLSVSLISFVLCFLFGAWWGHRLHQKDESPLETKATLTVVAEKGFFPLELSEQLFKKYQVKLNLKIYESPAELMKIIEASEANSGMSFDLIQFPSTLFKTLQHKEILAPLQATQIPNISNISKDLRFAIWDPEEDFALPLSWNGLLFIYNPKHYSPKEDSFAGILKNKTVRISLLKDRENIVWLTQTLKIPHTNQNDEQTENWIKSLSPLPWQESPDIESFNEGKTHLLQISWSDLQAVKNKLGDFKIWYPKEKNPFFIDFIAVGAHSSQPEAARSLINQLLDKDVYPELMAGQNGAAVMEISNSWEQRSARFFRQLPLTLIRPLLNLDIDIDDLERAQSRLFTAQ